MRCDLGVFDSVDEMLDTINSVGVHKFYIDTAEYAEGLPRFCNFILIVDADEDETIVYQTQILSGKIKHRYYDYGLEEWSEWDYIKPVKIDTSLSSTSTNPVQNKVINTELDNINRRKADKDLAFDYYHYCQEGYNEDTDEHYINSDLGVFGTVDEMLDSVMHPGMHKFFLYDWTFEDYLVNSNFILIVDETAWYDFAQVQISTGKIRRRYGVMGGEDGTIEGVGWNEWEHIRPMDNELDKKADKTSIIKVTGTEISVLPNKFYDFGTVADGITVTLSEPSDASVLNEYMFEFVCGADGVDITITNPEVVWANKPSNLLKGYKYQFSILNGVALWTGVNTNE